MPCSSGSRMGAFVRGPFSTTTSPERPRMRDGEVVETCGNSGCSPADEALAVGPAFTGEASLRLRGGCSLRLIVD